jgi:hypothetical protein
MTRLTIAICLLAGLAGCYPATPLAVRTPSDKASQKEAEQRWKDMRDEMDERRAAWRAEARELERLSK